MPFNESGFKSKIRKTKPTEKSIATLTKEIIHYRKFYQRVLEIWLHCFRKADVGQKLTILYVINHTLQEAKKTKPGLEKLYCLNLEKIFEVFGSDKTVDDYTIKKTSHVLQIWEDRDVLPPKKVRIYKKLFTDKSFRKKWARDNAGKFPRDPSLSSKVTKTSDITINAKPTRSRSKSKAKKSKSRSRSTSRPGLHLIKATTGTPEGSPDPANKHNQITLEVEDPTLDDLDINYSRTLFDDGSGQVENKKLTIPDINNSPQKSKKSSESLLKTVGDKSSKPEVTIDATENEPHSPAPHNFSTESGDLENGSATTKSGENEKAAGAITNATAAGLTTTQNGTITDKMIDGTKPTTSKRPSAPRSNKKRSASTSADANAQPSDGQKPKKLQKVKNHKIKNQKLKHGPSAHSSTSTEDSIYKDLTWFDNVPDEIAGLHDEYINPAVIQMNQNLAVNPKVFADKMTAVLRAPPSLDSEIRTWLTNLPQELADPMKIDKIVQSGLEIQQLPTPDPEGRRNLYQKIGSIFKDIQEFKNYLSKYNDSLAQELVQRRDLGCYLQLLGKERKASHKYYIDRVKTVGKRQEKANFNAEKIRLMCSEPKLPDMSDVLPDLNQLFENDESYQR